MTSNHAVIFGAGGHAVSVAEAAISAGYDLQAFIDDRSDAHEILDIPVRKSLPTGHLSRQGVVFVAVGPNDKRAALWSQITNDIPLSLLPPLYHPRATVSAHSTVGPGSILLAGSVLGPLCRVGMGCIINTGSLVDHGSTLSDFCSLAPGVTLGGDVHLGRRTAISIGATVRHSISIGDDSVIGASSYVNRDLPHLVVAYGTPARIVRERLPHDSYL